MMNGTGRRRLGQSMPNVQHPYVTPAKNAIASVRIANAGSSLAARSPGPGRRTNQPLRFRFGKQRTISRRSPRCKDFAIQLARLADKNPRKFDADPPVPIHVHESINVSVGAFDRVGATKDPVIVTWLEPGNNTAEQSGGGKTTAVVLAGVYELTPISIRGSGKRHIEMAGT